ncbi:MAG: hypothetical protein M1825_002060 [Sarcosagium campestre]|nr:MAG: hypothetical protein M1825_002060 [Sarcosagium campestre]
MPPDSSSFTALNFPASCERPQWMGSFNLQAPPNTDLWRKPPSGDTSTAPILYTALRHPFVAAEVTISADWELEWDQGGLVIFAGAPPGRPSPRPLSNPAATATSATTDSANHPPRQPQHQRQQHQQTSSPPSYQSSTPSGPTASKWLKAGLEFYSGSPHASSVCATSDGADWALAPLSPGASSRSDLRVKLERVGYALWVWFEDALCGWKKLREVTWFFWGVEDKAVRVGVYASRPANFVIGGSSSNNNNMGGGGGDDNGDAAAAGAGSLSLSSALSLSASPSLSSSTVVSGHRGLEVEFEGLEIF